MSVYGTGPMRLAIPRFSCRYGYLLCQISRGISVLSGLGRPTPLQPTVPSVGGSVTPGSRRILHCGVRNLYRIAIRSPSRVSVRSRLTLIRLALFRNPWAFGARVSLARCRYSCLHLLFRTLQGTSRNPILRRPECSPTGAMRTARLRLRPYARSSSTRARSTSELLRTL